MNSEKVIKSVNEIIEYLKKYKFNFYFSEEELIEKGFRNLNIDWPSKPIYFASGRDKDIISVMAFGGCIGWISLSRDRYLEDAEKEKILSFAKYLSPKNSNEEWYKNEYKHSIYLPAEFVDVYFKEGNEKMNDILAEGELMNQMLCNKVYLDLMVCAAYVRYMHRMLEDKNRCKEMKRKTLLLDASERSIQTTIARKNMDNCKNQNMIIIDIEFKEAIEKHTAVGIKIKNPSVDFVVLDKLNKSFGLIEFKYQGESMNPKGEKENHKNKKKKGDNSLTIHLEDFMIMVKTKHKEIVERLIEHTEMLLDKKIIEDSEVRDILETIKNKPTENVLWCGFYFLDEKELKTSRENIKKTMKQRIGYDCLKQVIIPFKESIKMEGIDVRYQHSDVNDKNYWKLLMEEKLLDKEIEFRQENGMYE